MIFPTYILVILLVSQPLYYNCMMTVALVNNLTQARNYLHVLSMLPHVYILVNLKPGVVGSNRSASPQYCDAFKRTSYEVWLTLIDIPSEINTDIFPS